METGFYYLQSRYYDPAIGRFINADDPSNLAANGDFASYNLFAYCGNNPVARKDDGGEFWNVVIGAAVGGIVSGVIAGIASYKENGHVDWGSVAINAAVGAVSGAVAATGLGALAQAGITSAASGLGTLILECRNNGGLQSTVESGEFGNVLAKSFFSAAVGFGSSLLGSGAGSYLSKGIKSQGEALITRGTYQVGCFSKNAAKKLIKQGKQLVNVSRGLSSVAGTVFNLPSSVVMSGA